MTEPANAPDTQVPASHTPDAPDNARAVADAVADQNANNPAQAPESSSFDFVLDKYKADGRSDQDAANEQAKAYGELQSKFGSFTGAPDEYETVLSPEMEERVNLDDYADDPLLADFKATAKEMGINNEGFNRLTEMYFKSELAGNESLDAVRAEEMKALGSNADRRLENIQDWAKGNLDAETGEALAAAMTSASSVQAIEALIAKTRNAPQVADVSSAPATSHADMTKMLHAKDEFGNPMMNNAEYAAKVNKMYDQRFGAEPQNITL